MVLGRRRCGIAGAGEIASIGEEGSDIFRQFLPSCLTMVLINGRSVNKKSRFIHDLIVDKDIDLPGITETWLGNGDNVGLSVLCPPGFRIWHCPRAGAGRRSCCGLLG